MSGSAVHRDLRPGAHGSDVATLQRAVNRRLDARGQDDYLARDDGTLGPKTARACGRALFLLGAADSTYVAAHDGRVTIGAQRMIRYPGRRSTEQLRRARARMRKMLEAREERAEHAERRDGIEAATDAMQLLLAHAPAVHYTQGPLRWQGIRERRRVSAGSYPNFADCSSAYTWALWQALGGGSDVVNGAGWTAGFTGTLLTHGRRVSEPVEGAAIIYGDGWPGKHVAYAIGHGKAISHGSEAAPFLVDVHYRPDVMEFRVYG